MEMTQEQLDSMVQDRLDRAKVASDAAHAADLAEERRKLQLQIDQAEAKTEAIRAEAKRRAGVDQTVDTFITNDQREAERLAARRVTLNRYFGSGSSGKMASDLMKESPSMYAQMKLEAQKVGLLSGRGPIASPGKRAFANN